MSSTKRKVADVVSKKDRLGRSYDVTVTTLSEPQKRRPCRDCAEYRQPGSSRCEKCNAGRVALKTEGSRLAKRLGR